MATRTMKSPIEQKEIDMFGYFSGLLGACREVVEKRARDGGIKLNEITVKSQAFELATSYVNYKADKGVPADKNAGELNADFEAIEFHLTFQRRDNEFRGRRKQD